MSDAVASTRAQRARDLLRCTHPVQAVTFAVTTGVLAAADGRPAREYLSAAAAMLAVQLSLGLSNDVCDADRDARAGRTRKPIAVGRLASGDAAYWMMVALLVAVPLSIQNGAVAGLALLATVPIGWIHNRWLQHTWLSWLGWAATFALYPAFLSYGGWGGGWGDGLHGNPPTYAVTGVAAGIGICLHFITSLGDLVGDHRAGSRSLPLRIAMRIGAPRLLVLTILVSLGVAAATVGVGLTVGLRQ